MSIRGESAKPVEKYQIATRRLDGRRWFCVRRSSWCKKRNNGFSKVAPVDLFHQRTIPVIENHASNGLKQNAVLA